MESLFEGLRISPMTLNDYERVIELWTQTSGVGLSGADEKGKH